MAKRAGMYKSDKRKKEVMRQKKQEEKRLRRLNKPDGSSSETETAIDESGTAIPAEGDGSALPEETGGQ